VGRGITRYSDLGWLPKLGDMTTSPTSDQHWEQPAFDPGAPRPFVTGASRPFVTGPILLPVISQVNVPAPTQEEQNLRTFRALLWPFALVIAIVTGSWWPLLIVAIVLGAFLKRRLRALRHERYAAAQLLR